MVTMPVFVYMVCMVYFYPSINHWPWNLIWLWECYSYSMFWAVIAWQSPSRSRSSDQGLQDGYLVFMAGGCVKDMITWPQGAIPAGLCLLAELSSLLGAWSVPLGNTDRFKLFLHLPHKSQFVSGPYNKAILSHTLVWWETRKILLLVYNSFEFRLFLFLYQLLYQD